MPRCLVPCRYGQARGLPGLCARLRQVASQPVGFAENGVPDRSVTRESHGTSRYRLLQQPERLGSTPGQGIRKAQGWSDSREPAWSVHNLGKSKAVFKQGDGLVQVPFAEGYRADTPICPDLAEWVIDRLGNPDPLFAHRHAFAERSDLGQAQCQPDP